MTEKEAQKILDELNTVRIEVLNDEAKRLFEAIMKIADERDKIKQEYDRDTHILQNQLDLADAKNFEKDKIIDSMVEEFKGKTLMYADFAEEEIKQYFENKSKEV